jgi:hypothetical protein
MHRVILLVSILAALMLIIISSAMYNYITTQSVSSPDTKVLNMNSLTRDGNGTDTNATAENTQPSSVLNENEKIESLENIPTKCLGSALCPDYDYYPSSLQEA